jgi:hypothetical protein
MADEDIVARMERMLAEKEKKETMVGTAMKNGGGALTGGLLGVAVTAPAAVWIVGALAAPFTGGLSVAASAVVGHKMAKDID